jgi:hypothetical protein
MPADSFTITGQGTHMLTGGFQLVLSVEGYVSMIGPSARILSSTTPKRLLRVGWVALGFDAGLPAIAGVGWSDYFSWEYQAWSFPGVTYDRLIWSIDAGSSVDVIVAW